MAFSRPMRVFPRLLALFALLPVATTAHADDIAISAEAADSQVTSLNTIGGTAADPTARVGTGTGGGNSWRSYVIPFSLAAIPTGSLIEAATFDVYLDARVGSFSLNNDLYGFTTARSSATVLGTDNFNGTFGTDATDAIGLQDNFATSASSVGVNSLSGAALVDYLNTFSSLFGTSNFIFLRLSPDGSGATSNSVGINYRTADYVTVSNRPVLTVTTAVPEPATAFGLLTGLGMLVGFQRMRHR
jgi:hypothetical protein